MAKEQDTDEMKKSVEQVALYAAAVFEGKTKPGDIEKYKRADNGHIETQIVPFHDREISEIKRVLLECARKKEAERITSVREAIARMQKDQAKSVTLDVGLSGRMANSELIYNVDGALAVAHAITTHAVEPQDVDWFTAVDDLTQETGEAGAGHLNTQEFSAGVFYRYASLNLKQLQVNLGLLENMESAETLQSRVKVLDIAKRVFHMLATVVPSAKRQPFAADNLADFAIVSLSNLPVSLANAFERPVERAHTGGYLAPSELALASYWRRLKQAYALDEQAVAFRFDDAAWAGEADRDRNLGWPEELVHYDTLAKVEAWIAADGKP